MIPDHMEPKGLAPDAKPIADGEIIVRTKDAARGSADLRDAILVCMGQLPPINLPDRSVRNKLARPQKRPEDLLPCQVTKRLQRRLAEHYGITVEKILSPTKARDITLPRQAGMYLLRHLTKKSYPDIARLFGRRDHTTAIYAVRRIERLRAERPDLDESLNYLREELEA